MIDYYNKTHFAQNIWHQKYPFNLLPWAVVHQVSNNLSLSLSLNVRSACDAVVHFLKHMKLNSHLKKSLIVPLFYAECTIQTQTACDFRRWRGAMGLLKAKIVNGHVDMWVRGGGVKFKLLIHFAEWATKQKNTNTLR